MSVYTISYDLNQPGQQYQSLYRAIKSSGTWWHYLDSTWLLSTNKSAAQVSARLREELDETDSLLVIKVTDEYSGYLPKKAWDWIQHHVKDKAHS